MIYEDAFETHNDSERECEPGCPWCVEEEHDIGGEG